MKYSFVTLYFYILGAVAVTGGAFHVWGINAIPLSAGACIMFFPMYASIIWRLDR